MVGKCSVGKADTVSRTFRVTIFSLNTKEHDVFFTHLHTPLLELKCHSI